MSFFTDTLGGVEGEVGVDLGVAGEDEEEVNRADRLVAKLSLCCRSNMTDINMRGTR